MSCLSVYRVYQYTVMETIMDESFTTRYKCCNGWNRLGGETGCTYSELNRVIYIYIYIYIYMVIYDIHYYDSFERCEPVSVRRCGP